MTNMVLWYEILKKLKIKIILKYIKYTFSSLLSITKIGMNFSISFYSVGQVMLMT